MITLCLSLIGLEECAPRLSGGQLWVTGRMSTPVWPFWAHACVLECCALPQRAVCVLVAGQRDALPAMCVSGECSGTSGAPLEGVRP